jgi:hypothetical protein
LPEPHAATVSATAMTIPHCDARETHGLSLSI